MHDLTHPVLNLSAYRFVELADPADWRARIEALAQAHGVRGTVLLAGEGINLFVAAPQAAARAWWAALTALAPFTGMVAKESHSHALPFARLKVKVKREIIRMNQPTLRPATAAAPNLAPATLARWLAQGGDDEGRPVVMLDTRNAFEVDAGAFDGALDWRLAKFSDFPAALAARGAELRGATVVSYCTGGIRCEKAALALQDAGLRAWQLQGGILNYFEQVPGAPHWHGDCVVFDERGAVNTALQPAPPG